MTDTVEPITLEERARLMACGTDEFNIGAARIIWSYEAALRASEERIKKLEVRINAVFGLLNSAFEEQESLLKNDYLFSAFSHVFPVTTPTEE